METAICLPLCLLLTGCLATSWRGATLAVLAQLALLAIDPQIVNVSSVYSTSALVMAACLLSGGIAVDRPEGPCLRCLLALVYAGLIALKTTNAVFVISHYCAVITTEVIANSRTGGIFVRWVRLVALTSLFLLPWFALHSATYADAIGAPVSVPMTIYAREPFNLFSTSVPFFGVPQVHFTIVAFAGSALAAAAVFFRRPGPLSASPHALGGMAAGMGGAASYVLLVVVLAPLIFGQEASTRYCSPLLAGAVPATIVLVGSSESKLSHGWQALASASIGIAIFVLFAPSLQKRLQQITEHGSLLAFTNLANSPIYLSNYQDVLGGKTRATHERIQALVPEREPVIVWTLAPFWLNFARNPIYNTSQHGLGMPRKTWPKSRYFLWQYRSPAMLGRERYQELLGAAGVSDRVSAARALEFIERLEGYARTEDILFNDGEYALIRLRE